MMHPAVLRYVILAALALMAWTALVAAAVRWTTLRDVDRWWLLHMDEASRHEVWVRDEALRRANEKVIRLEGVIADQRAALASARKAALRVADSVQAAS